MINIILTSMDKYAYLLISIFLSFIWVAIFIKRRDLQRQLIQTSIIGGFAGLIAEHWYFRDYWRPPSLLGTSVISIEDFLFGFFITGIAATIYDSLFMKENNVKEEKKRKRFFGILFILGVISLLIFNTWLGVNSIFVSSFIFLIISVVIIHVRKDLLAKSVISGLLTMLIIIPIYAIIFNIISPDYISKYFLLTSTRLGTTILGNIPLTELLWYFSWGCLAGIGYDFVFGKRK